MVIVVDRNVPALAKRLVKRGILNRAPGLAAALLVFFAAAAGAGIVAADLDGGTHRFGLGHGLGGFADHVLSLVRGTSLLRTKGTGGLVDGL